MKRTPLVRKTPLRPSWGNSGGAKFSNVPTNVLTEANVKSFPSKLEADRYVELRIMEKNGEIQNLQTQVTIRLVVNGHLVCKIIPDFAYERRGKTIYEDTKGIVTPLFGLKKKLARALGYEVEVLTRREVGRHV